MTLYRMVLDRFIELRVLIRPGGEKVPDSFLDRGCEVWMSG